MQKIHVPLVAISIIVLASCGGGSDSSEEADNAPEPSESQIEEPDLDDSPGLTVEEIGDDSIVVLGSYRIDGEQLLDGADGPPPPETVETFAVYTDVIPDEYREGVIAFVAIDQEASDGVDGAMQDVYGPDGEPSGERYLALDVTGASTTLERTIVHETGHLIFGEPGGAPTSYAVAFNEQFPPGAEYSPDDFVTEYAATSEDGGEDIAESWAMFVYEGTEFAGDADEDGELDEVPDDTIAADKVAFFEQYPELVALKEEILG